jgi:hypothetical protein
MNARGIFFKQDLIMYGTRFNGGKMKFISDGTWFDKGTEVKILVECGTVWSDNIPTLSVLASGLKDGYIDEERCCMEEFIAVGDDYEFKEIGDRK